MRILLLAPYDLFPPVHGGSSLVYSFVRHASRRHDVTALISHLYSQGGPIDLASERLHVEYCPPSPFDRLRVLSFVVNPHYYRAAEQLFGRSRPQVVHCETLWTVLAGRSLHRKHGLPLIWVAENIEARKFAEIGYAKPVVGLLRLIERVACQCADHIIVLSRPDRQGLIDLYGAPPDKITVITPGPDLEDFFFDEASRSDVRKRYGLRSTDALLTFVGNLQYLPNQQAVRRISQVIYPAVSERYPSARFVIIGQRPELLSDFRRENIVFTGYLSRQDLIAHLCATDVFLVPVETGSGIRMKIPEATACGRVVVATRQAAAGLEMFEDDEILRVQAAGADFVAAVLQVIEDPELRDAIGRRARVRTQQEFGWERTLAAYEQVYAKVGAL